MYLTQIVNPYFFSSKKHHHHHHYSAATKKHRNGDDDADSLSFDEVLLPRFKALPPPPPVVSLSWLHSAFEFLSFTHTEAAKIFSSSKESPLNPLTETGVDDFLSFYLDDSVKVLHINNYILSEVDRFRSRALSIRIALHLLISEHVSSPDKLKKARDYLSEVEEVSSRGTWKRSSLIGCEFAGDVEDLVKDLAAKVKTVQPPPSGKVSAVRHTVHAAGLVSVLISGAAVSALRGSAVSEDVIGLMAPAEFAWAESFNELTRRLNESMLCSREIREMGELEARVKELVKVIDDVADGKGGEELLNGVAEELVRVTEELREGLGKLANGVNQGFNAVMRTRRCVLDKVSRSLWDN